MPDGGDPTRIALGWALGTYAFTRYKEKKEAGTRLAWPGDADQGTVERLASALAGLCYSEFASTVPIAGSAYTYGYATLGEFIAWVIGWDLILEYALGAATVAVGWSGHLTSFLHDFVGINFPAQFAAAPGTIVQTAGGSVTAVFNLPAVIITILVTILIVIGIKESANVNTGIVIVKIAVGPVRVRTLSTTPAIRSRSISRPRARRCFTASSLIPSASPTARTDCPSR